MKKNLMDKDRNIHGCDCKPNNGACCVHCGMINTNPEKRFLNTLTNQAIDNIKKTLYPPLLTIINPVCPVCYKNCLEGEYNIIHKKDGTHKMEAPLKQNEERS